MSDPLTNVSTRATAQPEQADPRQVKNSAGGYTFTVDDTARLRRFLVLGTAGGTYYTGEQELTKDNAAIVLQFAKDRTGELVDMLLEISLAGRAPKQNPTIFALAAAAGLGDEAGRRKALAALPQICRTGTHLFLFSRYVEQFRGWGRSLIRAVSAWYTEKPVTDLAYQMVKYRQRDGVSHRDLLRLSHPVTAEPARRALFNWTISGGVETSRAPGEESRTVGATVEDLPGLVTAFEAAQEATKPAEWIDLIQQSPLSWEMLPDAALNHPTVWEALLDKGMPQTALMRQLPRLTRLGVLGRMSARTVEVARQLQDPERLKRARVHPVNVLIALRTYASGYSARGSSEWKPVAAIVDALDAAFYAAFGAVQPADKRTMLALDVSGSMTASASGLPISCREASAALALVSAATEPMTLTVGFTSTGGWGREAAISELPISPRQRLNDAIGVVSNLPFGATDCSLPMVWALQNGVEVDTFQIYTDNETWHGNIHPHQALRQYREKTGINARLAVVAMTPTQFSIADPADPGQLDVAGFDSAVPTLLADFSRGDV